jgi:hypothetical protein
MAEKEDIRPNVDFLDNVTEFLTETGKGMPPEALRGELYAKGADIDRLTRRVQTQVNEVAQRHQPAPLRWQWRVWRNAALALALLLVLAVPIGIFKIITLQKAATANRSLPAGSDSKDQLVAEEREKVAALSEQLAAMQKESAKRADSIAALGKKVDELSQQNRGQVQRVETLRRKLEEYVTPRADAVLLVQFLATRASEPVREIDLSDKLFLRLQARVPKEEDYQTYRLVIVNNLGNILWQANNVRKDSNGNFDVQLGRDFLAPGDYVFEIYGVVGEQKNLISRNRFRII